MTDAGMRYPRLTEGWRRHYRVKPASRHTQGDQASLNLCSKSYKMPHVPKTRCGKAQYCRTLWILTELLSGSKYEPLHIRARMALGKSNKFGWGAHRAGELNTAHQRLRSLVVGHSIALQGAVHAVARICQGTEFPPGA